MATGEEINQKFSQPDACLGIVCGKVSGNQEVFDFDDKGSCINEFIEAVESKAPGLIEKLTIQKTQSGGRHIAFRCSAIKTPGSTKLARRYVECSGPNEVKVNGKKYTPRKHGDRYYAKIGLIETKGEGGYILADPTPGYKLVSGSFDSVPEISIEERETLIDVAKSFDQPSPFKKLPAPLTANLPEHNQPDDCTTSTVLSPGDDFNNRGDIRPILEKNGWIYGGDSTTDDGTPTENYRRPGKTDGNSASLLDGKIFHVFTSNGAPFEASGSYSLFTVYAHLECDGDFKLAAKKLRESGYGDQPVSKEQIETIVEKAQNDPSSLFAPKTADTLHRLFLNDREEYERIRLKLKNVNDVRITELDKIIKDKSPNKKDQNPVESEAAKILSKKLLMRMAYNKISENRMEYKGGLWSILSIQSFREKISAIIESDNESFPLPYTSHYFKGVIDLLRNYLPFNPPPKNLNLLPIKNGVLDLDLKILNEHKPEFYLTWQIPFFYTESSFCVPISWWLYETLGDFYLVQKIRAYLNAAIKGRVDLQKFLELVGPGGSGKSTLLWLFMQVVGNANTITTELKYLETNRFETASLYGKKLVLIADAEKYSGDVSVLKSITGGDYIRYEEKHKQSRNHFQPEALVIIAANDAIRSNEYTSGLRRRRDTIYFNNPVAEDKQRDLKKEFSPYIAGLLNWALELSDNEVTKIIKQRGSAASKINAKRNILDTNPMAAWLHDNIIYNPETETNIGSAPKQSYSIGSYKRETEWLYPNYKKYCDSTGVKAISLQRFSQLLDELCQHQLHLPGACLQDKSAGGRTFKGLSISNGKPGISPVDFSFNKK
ncbi:phage/plasmid primase, P4 family [Thermodesulfobacteriota bacterium]